MKRNKNLNTAKKNANDEFYTSYEDISKEMENYLRHFEGKVIYMNCDGIYSEFWNYFYKSFKKLKLKKIISTSIDNIYREFNGFDFKKKYINNGDFRSDECLNILKSSDIVITNPPFSLFREFIEVLHQESKQYLVIGNFNAVSYKENFKKLKLGKLWLGVNKVMNFKNENGEIKKINARWFTNIKHFKKNPTLKLTKKYNESEYVFYENYNAINIDKLSNIPYDYLGVMGVPLSFIDNFNPDQFEIVTIPKVGLCDFTKREKMIDLRTGKFSTNAKGNLYMKYNPKFHKKFSFKNTENNDLYTSPFSRILIKIKNNS